MDRLIRRWLYKPSRLSAKPMPHDSHIGVCALAHENPASCRHGCFILFPPLAYAVVYGPCAQHTTLRTLRHSSERAGSHGATVGAASLASGRSQGSVGDSSIAQPFACPGRPDRLLDKAKKVGLRNRLPVGQRAFPQRKPLPLLHLAGQPEGMTHSAVRLRS